MGKNASRPVYDWLLSVDYGLCHGELSSLNQIWVKERPILCGQYTQNAIETVWLPERHGGDDAEGGVDGVVEIYLGGDAQVSSEALAARYGSTSADFPGYQGVAHLFFRGASSGLADAVLTPGTDVLDGTTYSWDNGQGFRWTSNNPYFPEMKAHVTRFSDTLGLALPGIPSIADVNFDSGGTISFVDANNGYQMGGGGVLFVYPASGNFSPGVNPPDVTAAYAERFTNINLFSGMDANPYWAFNTGRPVVGAVGSVAGKPADPAPGDFGIASVNTCGTPSTDGVATTTTQAVNTSFNELTNDLTSAYSVVDLWLLNFDPPPPSAPGSTFFGETMGQIIADGRGALTFALRVETSTGAGAVGGTADGFLRIWSGTSQGDESALLYQWDVSVSAPAKESRFVTVALPAGHEYVRIEERLTQSATGFWSCHLGWDGYWDEPGTTLNITGQDGNGGVTVFSPYQEFFPVYAYCAPNGDLTGFPDDNPASMIYEILTDTEWGKGEDPANIDIASFQAAAAVLEAERMGMSQIWVRQDTIEAMIQDILDHIKGFFFINPMTGLYQLRLLRYDYVIGSLPSFDETNCKAKKRKRRAWGETINEIVVSYTNPNNEEPATVSAQDDGNIEITNAIVSETREYSGFRNPYIAQYVAERDVREAAYPLFSAVLEVDRRAWNILPGDVFKFSWAKDQIVDLIVRVMSINYGKPKSKTMQLVVVEDIFALELTSYGAPQQTEWTPDISAPVPFDREFAMTAPTPVLQKAGYTAAEIDANYPASGVMFFGGYDTATAVDFQAHTTITNASGGTEVRSMVTAPVDGMLPLQYNMTPVAIFNYWDEPFVTALFNGAPASGDLAVIGDSEANHEIVMLGANLGWGWEVYRAMWDTIQGNWVAGVDYAFSMKQPSRRADPTPRSAGETRTWRLLPRTIVSRLNYADAADVTITVSERAHRPFRPANIQLDGNGFATTTLLNQDVAGQFTATWSNRNRTLEDSLYNRWNAATVTPEAGQTTKLEIYDNTDTLLHTYSGLTGTSHVISDADFTFPTIGYVVFKAENTIGESLFNARRDFDLTP